MRQAGEPSVEEILESIKKVIARDNRTASASISATRERVPAAVPVVADEADEILELSEVADLELHDDTETVVEPVVQPPLVTEEARVSMRESLTALAMLAEPGAPPQIVRSGETSLEELTRQLLRPALSDWLDKNLPAMVEKMVAAEISRIVGKKG